MGMTLIEKVIAAHTHDPVAPGKIVWMDLDVRSARDFGGANVVKNLRREFPEHPIADPAKTCFTFDCNVPANTIAYANNQTICRKFAKEFGLRVYDIDRGIGSHVNIEEGQSLPGTTVVGTDSHLNILGAVGAFGQGMGDQDIAFAMATGRNWFEIPPTIKVKLVGRPASKHVYAKDVTLAVVKMFGAAGALGCAVEFEGPWIDEACLACRITLASMATETGAIAYMLAPNEKVLKFFRNRLGREITGYYADADANYEKVLELDISDLRPQIATPGNPENVVDVDAVVGKSIDTVFIGSCTNGRFGDFNTVAKYLGDRKLAPGIMLSIVPATREVYSDLLKEGLVQRFFDAGCIVSNSGCGGCAAGQIGMTGKGEVMVSTSNRNFTGKQGDGETFIASPATAICSAINGKITSPESFA